MTVKNKCRCRILRHITNISELDLWYKVVVRIVKDEHICVIMPTESKDT